MDQDFWDDYQFRKLQVFNTGYKLFPDSLARWLAVIDGEPDIGDILAEIECSDDFPHWLSDQEKTLQGMVGSAELVWPPGEVQRLGAHLYLVRSWAKSWSNANNFDHAFFGSSDYNISAQQLASQIFRPLADELERFLKKKIRQRTERPAAAPASDRIVYLDHNSADVQELTSTIDAVSETLSTNNEYADPQDKERQLAELASGKALLKAATVRLSAIATVLVRCLKYLGQKFAEGTLSLLIKKALALLAAWLGISL